MAIELANWIEIPVKDMDRAKKFYESIFGFKLVDLEVAGEVHHCFPNKKGKGFSGALAHYEFMHPGKKGPLVYLNASPNAEEMLEKIKTSGGKILKEKTEVAPGFGYFALFEDTEGNMLALQSES